MMKIMVAATPPVNLPGVLVFSALLVVGCVCIAYAIKLRREGK